MARWQTMSGEAMQARRCSLDPIFRLAAEAFDKMARDTPELREQFKRQANEARGLLVAIEISDYIVLVD